MPHPAEAVLAAAPRTHHRRRRARREVVEPHPEPVVAAVPVGAPPSDEPRAPTASAPSSGPGPAVAVLSATDHDRVDELAELVRLVDTSAGALTGRADGCFTPAQLRTALERIDDRARAAASDSDVGSSPRLALLREGIRDRLEVSAGTGEAGPTFWRLDPRDGRVSAP